MAGMGSILNAGKNSNFTQKTMFAHLDFITEMKCCKKRNNTLEGKMYFCVQMLPGGQDR